MDEALRQEWMEILGRVMDWPESSRIALAKRILDSLDPIRPPRGAQAARSVKEFTEIGAGAGPAPDDETIKRWIEEHRVEKYG